MSILRDFVRVSRSRRCPVCDRADWCLVSRDEPPTAAICSREANGAKRSIGEAGYLHVLHDNSRTWHRPPVLIPLTTAEGIDFSKQAEDYRREAGDLERAQLAYGLGLTVVSLARLGIGWSGRHRAWSFPMSDADGMVRGIRLRYVDGRKLAVRGGREGLFIPHDLGPIDKLLIAEGPTDTAALLDLGFAAVGRPSCTGGVGLLVDLVRRRREREVVVVSDADAPGRRGADNLASVLVAYCTTVRMIEPPYGVKDARQWKRNGATAADVSALIDRAEPRRLRITTTIVERKGGCRHGS